MKTHVLPVLVFSLAVSAASVVAYAQVATPTSTVATVPAKLSRADKKFFNKAAESGQKEVAVSEAVASRLVVPGGKEFAAEMISAHKSVNSELAALAARKGVTLPAEDPDHTSKWTKKIKDLDEDYFEEMVDDHEKAVSLFEKASKSEDPDIAAFAVKTLPSLRHHLAQAEALEEKAE